MHDLGFELFPYLSYFSDWAPYVSFLSLNLKIWFGGKRFSSNEEVIAAVDECFKGFETSYFSAEIKKLEDIGLCPNMRWTATVIVRLFQYMSFI